MSLCPSALTLVNHIECYATKRPFYILHINKKHSALKLVVLLGLCKNNQQIGGHSCSTPWFVMLVLYGGEVYTRHLDDQDINQSTFMKREHLLASLMLNKEEKN